LTIRIYKKKKNLTFYNCQDFKKVLYNQEF
jgi:hypothetical protein